MSAAVVNPVLEQVCRRASTRAVLEVAWEGEVLRADDVMEHAGVTRSTALQALDALGELGLVEELSCTGEGSVMGRPARRFRLRVGVEAGVVVGLEAGQRMMAATVTDLAGNVLARWGIDIPDADPAHHQDPALRRELARSAVATALHEAGAQDVDVLVMGIGVPAPVDGHGCSPEGELGFWRIMHAGLPEMFREDFAHVRIENDAALAALAELHFGAARQEQDFVTLLLAWGIGAGVVMDGQLLRGANGAVGELGFFEMVEGIGTSAGFHEIVEEWVRGHWRKDELPAEHPWREYLAGVRARESLLALLDPEDPVVAPLFHELVRLTGRIVDLMAQVYDPAAVVIAGPVAADIGPVLDAVREGQTDTTGRPRPKVLASPLGEDVISLGAAAAARELSMGDVIEWALAKRRLQS